MPYKNVRFVKMMLDLFDDPRFIQECSDSQKLDYLLWLAMAGLTLNNSKKDPQWFKTRFNLAKPVSEITKNLDLLFETFYKMYEKDGLVKFRNFKKLHNPLRNADGTPKESQRNGQNKNKIKKERLSRIIKEYMVCKGWDKLEPHLINNIFKRNVRPAKEFALLASDEDIISAMKWLANDYKPKGLEWKLETVIKKYPQWYKDHKPSKQLTDWEKNA